MASRLDDDEYVANLLKEDAKSAAKTYALVGIDAFNPKRQKAGAPKPNTSFLRHIIRQTDSHNAALLAKEAEESNARLRMMNQEKQREVQRRVDNRIRKAEGRLVHEPSDDDAHQRSSKRGRGERDGTKHDRRSRSKERERAKETTSRKHTDRSKDRQRHKRRHEHKEEDRSARKRRHRNNSETDDDADDDSSHKRRSARRSERKRRHRSYPTSRSRSRSPSRSRSHCLGRDENGHRYRDRSRSDRRDQANSRLRSHSSNKNKDSRNPQRRSASPMSESDPRETLVGPLSPSREPAVRARGRGAHKANATGMDSRFLAGYDPNADMHLETDAENNWGDALEALRDRQRWKQQGADRLKAAGFTDEQVKKWEKGDSQNEDDVVWMKKGQAREWDRGKVVDKDGDVRLKADFGQVRKTLK